MPAARDDNFLAETIEVLEPPSAIIKAGAVVASFLFVGLSIYSSSLHNKVVVGENGGKPADQNGQVLGVQAPCSGLYGGYGDVDGDGSVGASDALQIQRYAARLSTSVVFTDAVKSRADVDGNRQVDSVDSQFIVKYVSGLNTTFPMCVDHDGDGFVDGVESYIGTEPYKSCGTGAWPPDFDNSGRVSALDLLPLKNAFGLVQGDVKYNRRADLNADGVINSFDLLKLKPFFDTSCTFAPAPRISMQVLPANTVTVGQTVTITWTSTNTIAPCDAVGTAPGWAGQKPTANTAGIKISSSSPILYDNLRLTCYGPGGQRYVTTSLKFNAPPPPLCSGTPVLQILPISVEKGKNIELSAEGLSNCASSDVIKFDSTTAGSAWDKPLVNCNLGLAGNGQWGCSASFTADWSAGGPYSVRALLDKGGNGSIEAMSNVVNITVTAPPPPPPPPPPQPSSPPQPVVTGSQDKWGFREYAKTNPYFQRDIFVRNYGNANLGMFLYGLAGCEHSWDNDSDGIIEGYPYYGIHQYLQSTWSANNINRLGYVPSIYDGYAQMDNTAWMIVEGGANIGQQWPGCTDGTLREWSNYEFLKDW